MVIDRFADATIIMFVLAIYLLETEATSEYFRAALAVLLVCATAMVIHMGRIVSFIIMPWSGALLGAACLAAIVNQVGVSIEFRTFVLNCVVALAFLQLLSNEQRIVLALKALGVAGLLASISLIAQFDEVAAASTSLTDAWSVRVGNTLPGANPNIAGMYLAIAFAASLSRACVPSAQVLSRATWLACSAVILGAVSLTGSRKAVVYCLVAAVILVGYFSRRLLFVVGIAVAAAIWALFNVDWLYAVLGHRFIEEGNVVASDALRAQAVFEALDALGRAPFGSGWGSSQEFLSTLGYTHSNYLEVLVSLGLVGLLIYYYAHARIFRNSGHMAPGVRPAVVALMIAGLALDLLQVTYLYKAPILVLALGSAAALHARSDRTEASKQHREAPSEAAGQLTGRASRLAPIGRIGYRPKGSRAGGER